MDNDVKIEGELILKKVAQGRARFEGVIDEVTGLSSIIMDAKVLGDYDPAIHKVTGTIIMTITKNP